MPEFDSTADAYTHRERLREQGYDGIVVGHREVGGLVHLVAFDADQLVYPDADTTDIRRSPPRLAVDGVEYPTQNADGRRIHDTDEGVINFWRWSNGIQHQGMDGAGEPGAVGGGVDRAATGDTRDLFFDGDGRPRVFYHGTADDVGAFDLDHPNRKDHGWLGRGVYVTNDPLLAGSYANVKRGTAAPNVMPLYVSLRTR